MLVMCVCELLGILLTGVVLIEEMCKVNPDSLVHFKRVSVMVIEYMMINTSPAVIVCSQPGPYFKEFDHVRVFP